jgi:hypothetical protein
MSDALNTYGDYARLIFFLPDVKHHRIPAPEMSFTRPNLPVLIREIEALTKQSAA